MRKTVTFDDDVYKFIQEKRAQILMDGKELSFTEMVNILLRQWLYKKG